MRRFRFPLQKLLGLRHQETTGARQALALTRARTAAAATALRLARQQLATYCDELQRSQAAGMLVSDWAAAQHYLQVLRRQEAAGARRLAAAEAEEERARTELQQSRQRERMLELLREDQAAGHRAELQAEEQRERDDRPRARTLMQAEVEVG